MTATMQALAMAGFGASDQLRMVTVPVPQLTAPEQVRVRIHAAALNRIDHFVLGGLPKASYRFPHVVGSDGAGVVDSVGPAVTGVAPGDRVMLNPGIACGTCATCRAGDDPLCRGYRILGEHLEGTCAEYVVVPAANVTPLPPSFSMAEGAAFPLATLTAWRMLTTRAALQAGETALIWGTGGGVALAALQIAKLLGARTIVTSGSDEKLAVATRLGADLALNHRQVDVVRTVRDHTGAGADVVVDSVGQATWEASLRALRPMGRLVTCGATTGPHVQLDIRKLFWFQWSILGSTMGSRAEFAAIAGHATRGALRPPIDSIRPLHEGRAAFDRLAAGTHTGKIVLEVTA